MKAITMTYYTNRSATSKSMTEWYFGKDFMHPAGDHAGSPGAQEER